MRRAAGVLAALLLLLPTLGGCNVTTSRRPAFDDPVAIEVQKSQRLHLDLRTPLKRAGSGIPEGMTSVAYGRRAPGFLDVRLQLPGDRLLEMPATDATIAATGLDGGDRSQPDYVLIVRIEPDADAAERVLREEVERFGLDEQAVAEMLADVREPGGFGGDFVEAPVGYLRLTLTARTSESDEKVQLSYALSWDPDAAPAASPPPT